jgi:hypothetical protein
MMAASSYRSSHNLLRSSTTSILSSCCIVTIYHRTTGSVGRVSFLIRLNNLGLWRSFMTETCDAVNPYSEMLDLLNCDHTLHGMRVNRRVIQELLIYELYSRCAEASVSVLTSKYIVGYLYWSISHHISPSTHPSCLQTINTSPALIPPASRELHQQPLANPKHLSHPHTLRSVLAKQWHPLATKCR